MDPKVRYSTPDPGVALLLVDAPPMNFNTVGLMEELERGLLRARDKAMRVVVIGSAVAGYFIAHGHLREVVASLGGVGEPPAGDPAAHIRVHRELDTGPMVSIAAVDGQAWGGGAELAWACDLRVASEAASFGQPEVMVGVPTLGGAARIARLAGEAAAKRVVLDGRPVTGADAFRLGLVQRMVDDGSALDESLRWARWLARHPPGALSLTKESITGGRELSLRDALRRETSTFIAQFARPDVVQRALKIQQRYDAGADSREAFGIDPD